MRTILLSLLAGLACGISGTLAFHHFFSARPSVEPPEPTITAAEQIRSLQAQLSASEKQVTQLQAAQAKLAAQASPATPTPAPATKPQSTFPQSMIQAQVRQMSDTKIATLITRLKLSPDQTARLKAYFEEETKFTADLTARMLAGEKIDRKALAAARKNFQTEDQALEAILNPAQKETYKKMKEEERATQIETLATFELGQMSSLLQLDESQKDRFFQAIAGIEQELRTPEGRKKYLPAPGPQEDPTRYLEARDNAKLAAVKSVLTPAQWEIYRAQLESRGKQQREMLKAFLPTP